MSDIAKPVPRGEHMHAGFFEYCNKRELRFQRCSKCEWWRHMPRESCEKCGSFEWSWERSSGKARLFSWTTIHRALHPSFVDDVPYTVVIVEMEDEEGVRLATRLIDVADDELKLDLRLEVDFEEISPEVTLHAFRKAKN